jgi:hypothetical protein
MPLLLPLLLLAPAEVGPEGIGKAPARAILTDAGHRTSAIGRSPIADLQQTMSLIVS